MTDNAIIRRDGTVTGKIQESLVTIDDNGSVNIPTGETFDINGSPHTHASSDITGGTGTTDHSALGNLDYASAGHTGFAATTDLAAYLSTTDISGGAITAAAGNVDLSGTNDGYVLTQDASGNAAFEAPSGTGYDFVYFENRQTAGTNAGTYTNGAWRTVPINTEVSDAGGVASLSSNQITLAAGTYEYFISAPGCRVGAMIARLYNISDTDVVAEGTNELTGTVTGSANARSFIQGTMTTTDTKVFEIQMIATNTVANYGFGIASSLGTNEIYATAEFRKINF